MASASIRRYGARGAREELLGGPADALGIAVPGLREALKQTSCVERASIQCLFAIMAELHDTNLLHRGGPEGLAFVRNAARRFLDAGCVQRGIGGSARATRRLRRLASLSRRRRRLPRRRLVRARPFHPP